MVAKCLSAGSSKTESLGVNVQSPVVTRYARAPGSTNWAASVGWGCRSSVTRRAFGRGALLRAQRQGLGVPSVGGALPACRDRLFPRRSSVVPAVGSRAVLCFGDRQVRHGWLRSSGVERCRASRTNRSAVGGAMHSCRTSAGVLWWLVACFPFGSDVQTTGHAYRSSRLVFRGAARMQGIPGSARQTGAPRPAAVVSSRGPRVRG